jgi:hypothetical protein
MLDYIWGQLYLDMGSYTCMLAFVRVKLNRVNVLLGDTSKTAMVYKDILLD